MSPPALPRVGPVRFTLSIQTRRAFHRSSSQLLSFLRRDKRGAVRHCNYPHSDSSQQDAAQRFFTPTQVASGAINGERWQDGKMSPPILESLEAHRGMPGTTDRADGRLAGFLTPRR